MSTNSALTIAVGPFKKNRKDSLDTFATIIERLLRKSPAERYQTCSEFADDLRALPNLFIQLLADLFLVMLGAY